MRRRKRNRKKDEIILTPLQTTEALLTIGEEFDRKKAMLFYTGVLFTAIILDCLEILKMLILTLRFVFLLSLD